jgi:hypothetical protein
MSYSLPSDAREILHLLTADVIADTAFGSMSLESCRTQRLPPTRNQKGRDG